MYDLILYDTSNYVDFPIGGQLTSIRNFLRYIADYRPYEAKKILLVGISTEQEDVGKIHNIEINNVRFDFLPVMYRDSDLANVHSSLRLAYVKALFKMKRKISCGRKTVHYIHTPEAYIAVKVLRPLAKTAVFSHGSFFNMVQGFRFFQKNKLVHFLFEQFIVLLIKTADMLFVLDETSEKQYRKYTEKVFRVENSIVPPETNVVRDACHEPVRLLFVGRLSKVKQVDKIICAVKLLGKDVQLKIIGDGEERTNLETLIKEKHLSDQVEILGAFPQDKLGEYYQNSDILVMNSLVEGKPMTILEAMSYGLPVISTPVGGIPELVEKEICAAFTDGSACEITKMVKTIQNNYPSYCQNARNCSLKYSYFHVNERIFELITKTCLSM